MKFAGMHSTIIQFHNIVTKRSLSGCKKTYHCSLQQGGENNWNENILIVAWDKQCSHANYKKEHETIMSCKCNTQIGSLMDNSRSFLEEQNHRAIRSRKSSQRVAHLNIFHQIFSITSTILELKQKTLDYNL